MSDHPDQDTEATSTPRDDAAAYVAKMKTEWYTSMQTRRRKWARLDRAYHNYRVGTADVDDESTSEPRSNIGVPLAAETVDTAVARIHDNLLGRLPYGRVIGRESQDQLKSEFVQMVMDFQMQAAGFPTAAHKIFRDTVKYGTGFGKYHFKKEVRMVPQQVRILKNIVPGGIPVPGAMETVERTVMATPVLEHIHIQDIFLPLDAPDMMKAQGIVHRTWETKVALTLATDGAGDPLYDREAIKEIPENSPDSKDSDPELHEEYITRQIQHGGLYKDGKLAVLEYYGRLPLNIAEPIQKKFFPKRDPFGDWIVTIVDGMTTPLRVEPTPYLFTQRPYLAAKIIDDPGYITGISLIELVEKLGLTIDELYNIIMDNMNLILNKMMYVNDLAGIDDADLVTAPGKIIHGRMKAQDALQVIEFPDLSQSVFVLINMFLNHYKEYTGIVNPILGQASNKTQTATEIIELVAHSATRLGQFERMLEDTFMRPSFELWTLMNQQFIDQEFVIRIFKETQPIYPKVSPEDIQGLFDYIFEGSARAESQALRIGQIMQAMQVNATQPVPIFDPLKLGEQLLVEFGWKNIKEFINPLFKEQYAMNQELQMMKMMGETATALTPEAQAKAKQAGNGDNKANQGAGVPGNISDTPNSFQSVLAKVKETVLPQGGREGNG